MKQKTGPTKKLEVIIQKWDDELEWLWLELKLLKEEHSKCALHSDRPEEPRIKPKKDKSSAWGTETGDIEKLKTMLDKLTEKKQWTDEQNAEMKEEIKTLI